MHSLAHRVAAVVLAFVAGISMAPAFRWAQSGYKSRILLYREAKLRNDLFRLRSLIKQYSADKGASPNLVADLQYSGYISEIPKDPFTGER